MYKFFLLFFFTITTLFAGEIYIQLPLTKSTKNLYAVQKKLKQLHLTMRVNKYPQGYAPFVGPFETKRGAQKTLLKIRTYVSRRAKMYTTDTSSSRKPYQLALFTGGVMGKVKASEESNQTTDFLTKNSPNANGFNIGLSVTLPHKLSSSLEYEYLTSDIATSHNILTTLNYLLYSQQYFALEAGALLGVSILNFEKLPIENVVGDFKSISPLYGANMQLTLKATKEFSLILSYRPIIIEHELSIQTLQQETITIKESFVHQFLLRAQYSF